MPRSAKGNGVTTVARGRNYLAYSTGDAINAVLAAAGYSFRRLLAWLSILLLRILIALSGAAQLKPA
jgi:IS5 family transposase